MGVSPPCGSGFMVDVGAQLQICSATEQLRILLSRNTEQSLVTVSMQVNQLAS